MHKPTRRSFLTRMIGFDPTDRDRQRSRFLQVDRKHRARDGNIPLLALVQSGFSGASLNALELRIRCPDPTPEWRQ